MLLRTRALLMLKLYRKNLLDNQGLKKQRMHLKPEQRLFRKRKEKLMLLLLKSKPLLI